MSIKEMANAVRLGATVESVAPEGADIPYLTRIISRYLKNADKPKRLYRRKTKRIGRPKKRKNYASQVIAQYRATIELIERTNGDIDE